MTSWWWPAPAEGEVVPDYPPLDVTGRVGAADVAPPCGRWCIHTPAGPCAEQCIEDWIANHKPTTTEPTGGPQ